MKPWITKFATFLLLILIPLTISDSCDEEKDSQADLPELSVVDISQESDWDYWVVGNTGDQYYLKVENSLPRNIFFHPASGNTEYSIILDENGYPDKVIADGYIFIFKNFNGNKVDLGVVEPNGEIKIYREVVTDFSWDSFSLKDASSPQAWSDVIRWTGRVVGAVPCVLSVAATVGSGGVAWPLMAWSCGNYLFKLSGLILEDFGIQNGYTEFVSTYRISSLVLNCTSAQYRDCAIGAASRAMEEWADSMEEIEAQQNNVNSTESTLSSGHGDVQINLTWTNNADLDLHVIDPYGEEIYWYHSYSASGGLLDVDDIDGEGPENIYWPDNAAPDGTYDVYVHHFVWSSQSYRPESSEYTVIVSAFNNLKTFRGSVSKDQIIHVATFNKNGIQSGKSQSFPISTDIKNKK